jgi:two-component system nitrate/nitrite response regulator NarL
MGTVFLSPGGHCSPRWSAAFPGLELAKDLPRCLELAQAPDSLCWVLVDAFFEDAAQDAVRQLIAAGLPVIALSTTPSEKDAFAILSLGARGYCHAEAVPEQLREVAQVVRAGGFWMPPDLVQRLVSVASRIEAEVDPATAAALEELSDREQQVANLVGRGLSNREIAASLSLSERTIKAHLTSIFEKLAIRDRVQLALLVNRLPVH